jgi:hypothetical protein
MMKMGTRGFEWSEVQVIDEFDEEMIGIALEEREVSLVAQPDQQGREVDFENGERKIGYNGHSGLSCADVCWSAPQSLHILRPLSSSGN